MSMFTASRSCVKEYVWLKCVLLEHGSLMELWRADDLREMQSRAREEY